MNECMTRLIDKLAFHMHESWGSYQIKNGWAYGTRIDFDAKTHPSLRPYDEISVDDRWEVGQATTIVTTLAALGCTITESLSIGKTKLKYEVSFIVLLCIE